MMRSLLSRPLRVKLCDMTAAKALPVMISMPRQLQRHPGPNTVPYVRRSTSRDRENMLDGRAAFLRVRLRCPHVVDVTGSLNCSS